MAMYPDGTGRVVNTADYGTNGDAAIALAPDICVASSATVLVTIVVFNDRGEPYQTVDPASRSNQSTLDNAARRTQSIQNLVSGGTCADNNITTNWTYDTGGHESGLHAIDAVTGEQITGFSFGVTVMVGRR